MVLLLVNCIIPTEINKYISVCVRVYVLEGACTQQGEV